MTRSIDLLVVQENQVFMPSPLFFYEVFINLFCVEVSYFHKVIFAIYIQMEQNMNYLKDLSHEHKLYT